MNSGGCLAYLLVFALVSPACCDEIMPGDPGWRDPYDLFPPDSGTKQAPPSTGQGKPTGAANVGDLPAGQTSTHRDEGKAMPSKDFHLRRIVNHIMKEFKELGFTGGRFRFEGSISKLSMDILRKYGDGEASDAHEVFDVIKDMLRMKWVKGSGPAHHTVLDDLPFIGHARRPLHQDLLFSVLGGLSLTVLGFVIYRLFTTLHSNFWSSLRWILLVLFIISIPWEWYRMYSEAQSAQMAKMMKGIPEACRPDKEMSIIANAGLYFQAMFIVSEDPCLKYQKAMLMNPLSEVTPVQAIAVAFTRLFTDPLVYVFSALGKCTKALMVELPVVSHVFIAILIPIFLLVIIFLLVLTVQRYSIRVPFFLSITPTASVPTPALAPPPADAIAALPTNEEMDHLRAVQRELPEIRRLLEAHGQRQEGALQHLEGRQNERRPPPMIQDVVERTDGSEPVVLSATPLTTHRLSDSPSPAALPAGFGQSNAAAHDRVEELSVRGPAGASCGSQQEEKPPSETTVAHANGDEADWEMDINGIRQRKHTTPHDQDAERSAAKAGKLTSGTAPGLPSG